VPFPVCAPPKDAPCLLAFVVGCLGDRLLELLRIVLPRWPNFEELYALTFDSEREIELVAEMSWSSMLRRKARSELLVPLGFELADGHDWGSRAEQ